MTSPSSYTEKSYLSFPEPTSPGFTSLPSSPINGGSSSIRGAFFSLGGNDGSRSQDDINSGNAKRFKFGKRRPSITGRDSTAKLPPPPEYAPYQAEFFRDEQGEISTYDKHLNEDGEALYRFLREQGSKTPGQYIRVKGTHMEKTTPTSDKNQDITPETCSVTDFSFLLDLTDLLVKEDEPVFWSESDNTPAWRGATTMQTEPSGSVPSSSRVNVRRAEQKDQEAWEKERIERGIPPWKPLHDRMEENGRSQESQVGDEVKLKTEYSGRTMREWADDYAHSAKKLKNFTFKKVVYGWDFEKVKEAIYSLVRKTGYTGDIDVQVHTTDAVIHVRSPGDLSEIFHDPSSGSLLSVTMIYPAVCLWRRYAKNGGGEWAVGGTAYSLKKWVKVQGTFEGETIEDCKNWLKLRGYPLSSNTQFKLGQGGVYVLKGTQEGQWLRAWAETIRSAVNARVVHGKILPLGPQRVDPSRLVDVVNLDGF